MTKFTIARDLLTYLPNIDIPPEEQLKESAKLDELIHRKRRLIQLFQLNQINRQEEEEPNTTENPQTTEANVKMEQ